MKTIWFKNEVGQDAEEIRHSFVHASRMRKKLTEILQEKIDASRRASISKDAYNSTNWPYLQADGVGYERAMQEVMSLLAAESATKSEVPKGAEIVAASPKRGRGRPRKVASTPD